MTSAQAKALSMALTARAVRDELESEDGVEGFYPQFNGEKINGHWYTPRVELEAGIWNELREELMCESSDPIDRSGRGILLERHFEWYGVIFYNEISPQGLLDEKRESESYEEWEAFGDNIDA